MIAGVPPFFDNDPTSIIKKVTTLQYDFNHNGFKKVSPLLIDLLQKILVKRDKRPSADSLLSHPWINMKIENCSLILTPSAFKKYYQGAVLPRYIMGMISALGAETDNSNLGNLFLNVDRDGDGLITLDELLTTI